MPYQEQNALFRQRTSTFAQATTENPILLEGEKWWEVDAANLTTGRSKTGKDGRVVNDVIVGTAFNDLPFDPTGTGEGGPGDPTNLSITNRTATGLDIASSTGNDATVPLATEYLAGLLAPGTRAKAEGAVQAVALTPPSGWSTSSTNTGGSVTLTLGLPSGFSLPSNASQINWDTAYSMRGQWSGGATGLNAATGRTSLELGSAALAAAGDFATFAQGALAATAVQPPGLASTLAAYLTTVSAASSYQPLSANLTALAANGTAYYLARSNHSGTQPLSTISGLGTGIATALAVNAGAAGAPVLLDGAGGTPSSLGLVYATGLPLATGVSGLLPIANGGTGTATPGLVAGTHVTITGNWPNQTINATGGVGHGAGGTVTSVGLSLPALFTVTGSPVTTSGTLTATLAAQSANLVWAGPATDTAAAPTFRSLVAEDIPTIPAGQVSGLATVATSGGTGDLTETGSNQFFTAARAIGSALTGFVAGAGTVAATDSILQAINKIVGNIAAKTQVSNAAPAALAATAAAGTSPDAARIDHAHPRSTYAELGPVADGIVFTISNRGETATASTNYDESLPLSFAVTVTKITFITHIDNTGSSTTTLSAYKRTAAGIKTALLSANATLASGASVATGSLSGTTGVLSLAAGDRLGVDLIGLGTGASGIKCIIEFTRSAT